MAVMKTIITEDDRRVCVEVTGRVSKIETVIDNLRNGLVKAGFDKDCMTDTDYILGHLKDGEWDYRTDDAYCGDNGMMVNDGTISYENITSGYDGQYVYGCVSLTKKYYPLRKSA